MAELDIERLIERVADAVLKQNGGGAPECIAIGSGPEAYEQKQALAASLTDCGYKVIDVGVDSNDMGCHLDIAADVAAKVASGDCERGVMLDYSGVGSSIVCNKRKGVRAALCSDLRSVVESRERCNANILTMSGQYHSASTLLEMAKLWLETPTSNEDDCSIMTKLNVIEG